MYMTLLVWLINPVRMCNLLVLSTKPLDILSLHRSISDATLFPYTSTSTSTTFEMATTAVRNTRDKSLFQIEA